jgi:hypothetical protein
MKNIVKISAIVILAAFALSIASPAVAAVDWGMSYTNIGLGSEDVRTVAVNVIRTLLGLLGILALIIILIGGFRWMTSGGNEENVEGAKKTIGAGIIGLIIIFFAYAIVMFVFNVLGKSI